MICFSQKLHQDTHKRPKSIPKNTRGQETKMKTCFLALVLAIAGTRALSAARLKALCSKVEDIHWDTRVEGDETLLPLLADEVSWQVSGGPNTDGRIPKAEFMDFLYSFFEPWSLVWNRVKPGSITADGIV